MSNSKKQLPKHIKLSMSGVDSKNIYYIDAQHKYIDVKELTDKDIPNKQPVDYKLSLKVSPLVNGKQKIVQKTYSFSKLETLKSAVKFVADKRLELFESVKSGEYAKKGKQERIPTIKELGQPYWDNPALSKPTRRSYASFVKMWTPHLANKLVTEVTTAHLQAIVTDMLNEGRKPGTTLIIRSVFNPLFKQAIREELIGANPVDGVSFQKFDNTIHIDISNEGVQALMHEIYTYDKEPYRTIFMWLTRGRRMNEVLNMHYEDINTEKMSYIIKPEYNKIRRLMEYGLTKELLESVEATSYLPSLEEEQRLSELGYSSNDFIPVEQRRGRIFNGLMSGNKLEGATIRVHWKKILKLANDVESSDDTLSLRIHDIRHIIGNTLVSNGKTLEEVAAVLGHTNTTVTKRYSKVRRTVSDNALDDFMNIARPKTKEDEN